MVPVVAMIVAGASAVTVRSATIDSVSAESVFAEPSVLDSDRAGPAPRPEGRAGVPDTSVRRARVGEPVPNFEVERLRDSTRSFGPSDFEGRYVLLNLWATWCAPCVEKLPTLQRARKQYSEERLAILNISFDPSRSDAIDFLDDRTMPGTHAFVGKSGLGGEFGAKFAQVSWEGRSVRGLPNLTLVNPTGKVVAILRPTAQTGLLEVLKKHLP